MLLGIGVAASGAVAASLGDVVVFKVFMCRHNRRRRRLTAVLTIVPLRAVVIGSFQDCGCKLNACCSSPAFLRHTGPGIR